MPLVKFIGGATREDNTERIKLHDAEDGTPRYILRGGEAVEVSHEELKQLAGGYEVQVIEPESSPGSTSPLAGDDDSEDTGASVSPPRASTTASASTVGPNIPGVEPTSRGGQ